MTMRDAAAGPVLDRPIDCLLAEDDPRAADARSVHTVRPQALAALLETLPQSQAAWARARDFSAASGELLLLPGETGVAGALLGLGADRSPFAFGVLAGGLGRAPGVAATAASAEAVAGAPTEAHAGPHAGAMDTGSSSDAPVWRLVLPDDEDADTAVLGFCLGAYRFTTFRAAKTVAALLVMPAGAPQGVAVARATWLARDLINLPANRLGPIELAEAARDVAVQFGARVTLVSGDALAERYPTIHAVGAGSNRPPHALLAEWRGSGAGPESPHLSLVGKGVVFDTGGYDLKPSAGMLRMKKDMGGAAIVLALARIVMDRDLPVRLSLRLGCVENSVSGTAMRPSDVLRTRRGLTVEIGNTDAEGRLVLCDLLAEASDEQPDLLLDVATLTGAARVALGPDLPALFCNDESLAESLLAAGLGSSDPLWRLPLWAGYDDWLSSSVADLNNVSSRPMAGAVTAALFLQRFVAQKVRWAHLDSYAWNDSARSGRPEGGEALGLRALYDGTLRYLNLATDPEQSGNVIGTEPSELNGL